MTPDELVEKVGNIASEFAGIGGTIELNAKGKDIVHRLITIVTDYNKSLLPESPYKCGCEAKTEVEK